MIISLDEQWNIHILIKFNNRLNRKNVSKIIIHIKLLNGKSKCMYISASTYLPPSCAYGGSGKVDDRFSASSSFSKTYPHNLYYVLSVSG